MPEQHNKRRFSLYHLLVIALTASLGIAIKPVIAPLAHLVTGPLYIPGGAVAGGVYMLFPVLALSVTGIRGASGLCGLCQGLLVLMVGGAGFHGVLSVLSYTMSGLAVDVVMLLMRHRGCCVLCNFFGGIAANVTGTLIVGTALFGLPFTPLVLTLAASALSGGVGGLLAHLVSRQLRRIGVVPR